MVLTRRQLITSSFAAAACWSVPKPAIARGRPKIVVIGGGAGGASVVHHLTAAGQFDITLVEPEKIYTSCFYSNLYLGGLRTLGSLQHHYENVKKQPGITVAADRAASIDRKRKRVLLDGGAALPYDRLVVAPGISLDYNSVPGWSAAAEERMPHAWNSGAQTKVLKRQLDAVPDGGLIVVIAPPNPSRCPPGPYERVSMMAHALKSTGRQRTRIVILDPKDKFSKQPLFQQGWEHHYPGMIEWMPPAIHAGIKHVDPKTMTVETGFETYTNAALVNVIPAQRAGIIAIKAGLTSSSGYCPVEPSTMQSQFDRDVFILGDAAMAGDMPKSAFSASSQAVVLSEAIIADTLENQAPAEASYINKCWSLLAPSDSIFVSGWYDAVPDKITQHASEISSLRDLPVTRRSNYEDSAAWYSSITGSMFARI